VNQSIASGNLPAGTGLPPFASNTCGAGAGDEGTAMLEIVHDLAPGATLRFSEGISDKLQFIDSIDCLRDAGAAVIVDDIGFFDEPFFEDGIVADAVEDAVAAGVSFHSAAGNSGDVTYGAQFNATTTPDGVYHDFGGGNLFDRIDLPPGRSLLCILQWNDRFGSSVQRLRAGALGPREVAERARRPQRERPERRAGPVRGGRRPQPDRLDREGGPARPS
jgi:hypothetical protein